MSWWMRFNGSATKVVSFSHECILLPFICIHNMHQDTKSVALERERGLGITVLPYITSSLPSFWSGASSLLVSGIRDRLGVICPVGMASPSSSSSTMVAPPRFLYGKYPKYLTRATPGINPSGTRIKRRITKYAMPGKSEGTLSN